MKRENIQNNAEVFEIEENIYDEIGPKLNTLLTDNNRIYLEANPGTGKTFYIAQLGKAIKSGNHPFKKLIFCTPLRIIQDQICNELNVDFALNAENKISELKDSDKIITTTYKSLYLLKGYLDENTLIVIDEAHELLRNYSTAQVKNPDAFHATTLSAIYNSNSPLIFMSGTPTFDFHELLALKHVKINRAHEKKTCIEVSYSHLDPKEIALRYCDEYYKNHGNNSINVVQIKSIKSCEEISLYLNQAGFNSKVITSKKKEESTYKSIAKDSSIPNEINFIITTNVLNVGANILNKNIGGVLMLEENNPVEIKQFSKRFRNMDNKIDVINKIPKTYDPTKNEEIKAQIQNDKTSNLKVCLAQIEYQKKALDVIDNEDLKLFNEISPKYDGLGTNSDFIDQTLKKFLINQSLLNDRLTKTYNSGQGLINLLNEYDDIQAHTSETNSKLLKDLKESKTKNAKKEFKNNLDSLIDDFIKHENQYIYYSLEILSKINLDEKTKFKKFLSSKMELMEVFNSNEAFNNKNDILNNINGYLFYSYVLVPIIEFIPYFENLKDVLLLIKRFKPEHRNKHILSIHINNLINKYCKLDKINDSYRLIYNNEKEIFQSAYQQNKLLLDLVQISFEYLVRSPGLKIADFKRYLENNNGVKSILNKVDENAFPFTMLSGNKINTSFLSGIANGIFLINSKRGRFRNNDGKITFGYLFEQSTNDKNLKVIQYIKHVKSSSKSNKKVVLTKIINNTQSINRVLAA